MSSDIIEEAVKDIPNPFVHRIEFNKWNKVKLWIMTFTVFPIRFLLMIILLMIAWLLTTIGLIGLSQKEFHDKPMHGWRKFIKECEKRLTHTFFFLAGFQNIKIKGKIARASEAPILCIAPHSTFFDTIMNFSGGVYHPVVREQSSSTTIISTLIDYTQPVYVKRDDPMSRQHTIQEIRRRALSGDDWEKILIFPEGTCSNRTCLTYFKSGAFLSGVPVQPVCVRYPNKVDTVTWTWDGPGALKVIWYTLCQFHQACEIEFLPVYTPSEEEKQNPRLFADNVRNIMAKKLNLPTCDLSYDDIKYMLWAKERNLLHTVGLIKLLKLRKKLNLEKIEIKDELEEQIQKLKLYSSSVDCKEFAKFLGVPVSEILQDFCDAIDPDRKGFIDLRSYVSGLWLLRQDISDAEKLEMAFKTFCLHPEYTIGLSEFQKYMWLVKGISSSWSSKIFEQINKSGKNLRFDEVWDILYPSDEQKQTVPSSNGIHPQANNSILHDMNSISSSISKYEDHLQNGKKIM